MAALASRPEKPRLLTWAGSASAPREPLPPSILLFSNGIRPTSRKTKPQRRKPKTRTRRKPKNRKVIKITI